MKRLVCLLLLLGFLFQMNGACAEACLQYEGRIHPALPMLTLTVTDTGERTEPYGDNILQAAIVAQDGSLSQKVVWESIESPAFERIVPLVRLVDMNFDGFQDLVLLTAQGARNVFQAVSLWDEAGGQFRPVETAAGWDSEKQAFSPEKRQLELCNMELYPEAQRIVSSVADGYRYRTDAVYEWDSRYALTLQALADVYDAEPGLIGETVLLCGTGLIRCWDETYPEEWYCAQDSVWEERRQAINAIILDNGSHNPVWLRVANVNWVNLRKQDSKASPSLAKLNEGETVMLLVDACGPENGWVRVWYQPEDGSAMLTGYIWHSYLEPVD